MELSMAWLKNYLSGVDAKLSGGSWNLPHGIFVWGEHPMVFPQLFRVLSQPLADFVLGVFD